jgi:dimethylhistidine N-methyltransferase
MHAPSPSLTPLPTRAFASDFVRGLRDRPKRISPKYFYDEEGSRLFDRICELDEYYLTRTELGILRDRIASLANVVGPKLRVVELGSGSGNKTRALLDALDEPIEYLAVDVSTAPLEAAAHELRAAHPGLRVIPVCGDFTASFTLPPISSRARATLVYFPGSTIGNLAPSEATDLLRRIRSTCGPCSMIIGLDLKKDPARLHAAYNDASGVTAAFNKNLLARANRELGADFDVDAFAHYAPYVPASGRIEMHLVSLKKQTVQFAGETFHFENGETLLTEYSYKYTREQIEALASRTCFRIARFHTDAKEDFAVALLESTG